jgi:predicted outer membrane repeat protein
MKRILIVLTSLSLIAGFVAATPARVNAAFSATSYGGSIDLYVSQYGTADGVDGGGSCSNPDFNTIQDAVDYAEWDFAGPTEIYICNGIYYEAIDSTIGLTLVGQNRLKTIIDGSQNAPGDPIINHYDAGDSISVWDMTIRNGNGNDGGALYTEDDFYCENSVFSGNDSQDDGGAVFVDLGSDADLYNCSFVDNQAGDEGGALYVTDVFRSELSTFTGNVSEEDGGAVHADEFDFSRRDVFANNETMYDDGGAVYISDGEYEDTEIIGSIFRQNVAGDEGGAVYYSQEYRITITSSSFIGNTAGDDGGAINMSGSDTTDYLTITGGPRTPTIFQGNYSSEDGGAIFVEDDEDSSGMNVTNARFTDNVSNESGGAIYSADEIRLTSSTFTGNRAESADGGAVYGSELIFVTRSTFTRNTSVDYDGGAIVAYDDLTVSSSTFTNNTADDGGAIKAYEEGDLTVDGSTFTGNQAQGDLDDGVGLGGACDDDGPEYCAGEGGAIFTYADTTNVSRSTFKNNSATDEGGAIMGDEDTSGSVMQVINSTFIGNQAEEAGAISSRTLNNLSIIGSLFQANRAYGVDFSPNFSWAVGAVMVEDDGGYLISGNRFISNVGWGVGALYLVSDCGSAPTFSQASMRANTWRSNRVTGGQPQIYRDVRTEGNGDC